MDEIHWVSCLRENATSSSYGEGLETGRASKAPRQSITRQLLFKAIKQSLRIKTFIGTSENAVQTQIWTALMAMLLMQYLHLRSTWKWSFSNLVALLRYQLFVYRDQWAWINDPFRPPLEVETAQMALDLG